MECFQAVVDAFGPWQATHHRSPGGVLLVLGATAGLGPGPTAATEVSCSASSHLCLLLGHTCCVGASVLPLGCSRAFSGALVSGCVLRALDAAERSWSRETPNQAGEAQSTPVSSPV